jgi:hypothetical protein
MYGAESGQRGKQEGGIDQWSDIHKSAVRMCITVDVCPHLMDIVFRL